jgi:carbamoyl-phosphate synthase large subunit
MFLARRLPVRSAARTQLGLRSATARSSVSVASTKARSFTTSKRRLATAHNPAAPDTSAYLKNLPASFFKQPAADIKKVLVIGSGGLAIGQAGEFDYSGML